MFDIRDNAKEFKTKEEIYELVKSLKDTYDSLNDFGLEYVNYFIEVIKYNNARLSTTYESKKDAENMCIVLNKNYNDEIFYIKENIFLEMPNTLWPDNYKL